MGFNSGSYLDSLYTHDIPGKPVSSLPYSAAPVNSSVDIVVDSRAHLKLSEPFYGLPKPDKPLDTQMTGHYGGGKLLPPPAPAYPDAFQTQPPPRYDINKPPSMPITYLNQGAMPSDPSTKVEQMLHNPKQTLHYGQRAPQPSPRHNHSQYQDTIPNQETHGHHQQFPQLASPIPVHGAVEQLRGFQGAPVNPSPSYNQYHKSSPAQPQIHAPVPARPVPGQHMYNRNSEPLTKPCYICGTPFTTMNELSEHLKIHAQGMVNNSAPNVPQPHEHNTNSTNLSDTVLYKPSVSKNATEPSVLPPAYQPNTNSIPSTNSGIKDNSVEDIKCKVCGKAFLKPIFLSEHMKSHSVTQKFECKYCRKSYKSKAKCMKHEVLLHQRDVRLVYCELCDADFEFKANYLHHVQTEHNESTAFEPKVGVKKAVPLTGGSIDRSFESEESDSDKLLNCQICDSEIERDKLVAHLKTHLIYQCEKCSEVFVQKTEYVAHLMSKHRDELDASSEKINMKAVPSKLNSEKVVEGPDCKAKDMVDETDAEALKWKKKLEKNLKKLKKEQEKKALAAAESGQKKSKTPKAEKEKKKIDKKGSKGIVYDNDEESNDKITKVSENVVKESKKFKCSKCEESFSSKQELTEHAGFHIRDMNRYYCEICNTSYHKLKAKGYYIYHMKYHKDADLMATDIPKELICNLCSKPFTKDNLITHIKRDHALYSCDICEWSYSAEKVLVSHMRRIHPKTHKHYVFVKTDYVDTVLEHKQEEEIDLQADAAAEDGKEDPTKTIPCKVCDRRFSKQHYYERHMRSHASVDDVKIQCELCNTVFSCKGTYLYHIQHHSKVDTADENENVNDGLKVEEINDELNIEEFNDGLQVEKSGVKIKEETVVDSGKEIKSDNKKDNEQLEKPKDTTVTDSQSKQTTETILNPVTGEFEEVTVEPVIESQAKEKKKVFMLGKSNAIEKSDALDKTAEQITCKVCSISVTKQELADHVRTHSLFSCDLCEFSFLKKQKLTDHKQSLHLEEYIEDEIKLFEIIEGTSVSDIVKSEKEAGDTEKDTGKRKRGARLLNCSLCNKELKQDRYVEHLKGHIKPLMYCEFCEREYTKPNLLKMHEKSHERISHFALDLPFPKLCPVCDTKVESREGYVTHLRTHKRKGPFECKECQKVFTSEKNLDNHTKVYHEMSVKVFWKGDGEGLKFDQRTGRISEVVSDHSAEIREINELLKQNGRPEILHSATPRKVKERTASVKSQVSLKKEPKDQETEGTTESEEATEEEKHKTDTSDEEYVPDGGEARIGKRRSGRLADKAEEEENEDDDDDGGESGEDTEESQSGPSKRRKIARSLSPSEESSEDQRRSKRGRKAKNVPLKKVKKGKFKVVKKASKLLAKKKLGRLLRSTLEKDAKSTVSMKRNVAARGVAVGKRGKAEDGADKESVNSQSEDTDFPEKCPVCGTFQFSKSSYEKHSRIHTGENAYKCPVCEQSFTSDRFLQNHLEKKHKGYTPKNLRKRKKNSPETPTSGKLRTRTRNLEKDDLQPVSSSTPKRSPKLIVKLSPLQLDESFNEMDTSGRGNKSMDTDSKQAKSGKFDCDICSRALSNKWNYSQHMATHKKEKEMKSTGGKSMLKKKEKESKPFSCKDCSESFTKKRDLYIHTKVHQTEGNTEEEPTDVSTTDQETSVSQKNETKSQNSSKSGGTSTDVSNDKNSSKSELTANDDKVNNVKVGGRGKKQVDPGENVESNEENKKVGRGRKRNVVPDELEKSQSPERKVKKADEPSEVSPNKTENNNNSGKTSDISKPPLKGLDKQVAEAGSSSMNNSLDNDSMTRNSQEDKGCDEKEAHCDTQSNSADEIVRLDSSDADEKKIVRTPSITKMTAEKALMKWRAKVMDTLSSQIELNAAKKQEKLENPEIARVKEKLSTKTKNEVKNFECRICGVKFNAETVFRKHMDEHLYESPPYCSICDIYFMAIYPKKRLAEHNRKKHPIA